MVLCFVFLFSFLHPLSAGPLILDPGHGGKDEGGMNFNLREKELVLNLALKVKETITSQTEIKVLLTRWGDYYVPLEKRIALANAHQGKLYLSFHLNNNFSRDKGETKIYYFLPKNEKGEEKKGLSQNWETVQDKYVEKARSFALLLQKKLKEKNFHSQVEQVPLILLEGLNLPGVVIEFRFSPVLLEKKELISAISSAVVEFFK